MQKIKRFSKSQKGAVSVLVALTLPVLVGAGALAVDLAYLHVVRNELQNDADAAALAGARKLYTQGASALNWSGAASTASNAIALNRAAGHALADGQIQTGYWDTTQTATGLQGLPMTPGANDAPAVQVSLGKSDGQNQGPVRTFLASIWGVFSKPVRVTAVAGVSSPGTILPGGLFPFGISKCMYDKFWNMNAQPAAPRVDPLTGLVPEFKIGSIYHYDNCESGEWTSLDTQASGANTIEKLIEEGNPISMSVGDAAWMQTGVKTSLYTDVKKCSAAGNRKCEFVVVPTLQQVVSGTSAPIVGFACLQLLDAVGGSGKYILAKMSNQCPPPQSGGVGPNYGVISQPSLFK
ncbi:TadG family pilus assembly protein [Limnohabitans sp.]|uniref:TadG family pilus assembly protein n=1 Tax=Limnohabitans sp. TaxID=1907725 RepID=UPI0025BE882F|nr:TadG family pilus assembly protein [Limnohabitans sp.]